jgi:8-oxo-dGTP diphosphatase
VVEPGEKPRGARPLAAGPEVRAAGGVAIRERDGRREVAVVHRPKYDDWSLPKGKLAPDESWEDAALREVEEETGARCELEREIAASRYLDPKGRDKLVRYWRMRCGEGSFEPSDEVDEVRWLAPEEADGMLSYEHDRDILRSAFA